MEQLKRNKFGSSNEKSPGKPKPHKGTTKDEEENAFIENEGNSFPSADDGEEDDQTLPSKPKEPKERDLSNRPNRYKTMHADLCVIHDCDLSNLVPYILRLDKAFWGSNLWISSGDTSV